MLVDVVAVKPQPDYLLELTFANGERRCFDVRPLLTQKPWDRIASIGVFEQVQVAYGTVIWPGNIDIAPETLYDDSSPMD